jgi:hypothetical protein
VDSRARPSTPGGHSIEGFAAFAWGIVADDQIAGKRDLDERAAARLAE